MGKCVDVLERFDAWGWFRFPNRYGFLKILTSLAVFVMIKMYNLCTLIIVKDIGENKKLYKFQENIAAQRNFVFKTITAKDNYQKNYIS